MVNGGLDQVPRKTTIHNVFFRLTYCDHGLISGEDEEKPAELGQPTVTLAQRFGQLKKNDYVTIIPDLACSPRNRQQADIVMETIEVFELLQSGG